MWQTDYQNEGPLERWHGRLILPPEGSSGQFQGSEVLKQTQTPLHGLRTSPRNDIEREFLSWGSPAKIAADYGLANRAAIYRHAHAMKLYQKRIRNICGALERLIEKVETVPVNNASVIIQAIIVLEKMRAEGKLEDADDMSSRRELFECMSIEEYEAYAKDGTLPSWYKTTKGSSGSSGSEGDENA